MYPLTSFAVLASADTVEPSDSIPACSTAAGGTGEAGRRLGTRRSGHFLRWVAGEMGTARSWAALLAVAAICYALGHGALALSAGLLGRALVRVGDETGQTVRSSGRLFSTILFGLLGSLVKGSAGTLLAVAEARLAGEVGRSLRRCTLSRLLARG